jgi:hypothetical protein
MDLDGGVPNWKEECDAIGCADIEEKMNDKDRYDDPKIMKRRFFLCKGDSCTNECI